MIRTILPLLMAIVVISCKQSADKSDTASDVEDLELKIKGEAFADSVVRAITKANLFDTLGVAAGPIRILSSRIVEKEYSTYKDISLTYKNVSDKKIEAIRFRWYGENVFGEPADMGTSIGLKGSEGFGAGFVDDPLGPQKTRTSEWSINSRDAKKVVKVWPYEIVFSDGSKWKSTQNNTDN
jgi:hypothetical protein